MSIIQSPSSDGFTTVIRRAASLPPTSPRKVLTAIATSDGVDASIHSPHSANHFAMLEPIGENIAKSNDNHSNEPAAPAPNPTVTDVDAVPNATDTPTPAAATKPKKNQKPNVTHGQVEVATTCITRSRAASANADGSTAVLSKPANADPTKHVVLSTRADSTTKNKGKGKPKAKGTSFLIQPLPLQYRLKCRPAEITPPPVQSPLSPSLEGIDDEDIYDRHDPTPVDERFFVDAVQAKRTSHITPDNGAWSSDEEDRHLVRAHQLSAAPTYPDHQSTPKPPPTHSRSSNLTSEGPISKKRHGMGGRAEPTFISNPEPRPRLSPPPPHQPHTPIRIEEEVPVIRFPFGTFDGRPSRLTAMMDTLPGDFPFITGLQQPQREAIIKRFVAGLFNISPADFDLSSPICQRKPDGSPASNPVSHLIRGIPPDLSAYHLSTNGQFTIASGGQAVHISRLFLPIDGFLGVIANLSFRDDDLGISKCTDFIRDAIYNDNQIRNLVLANLPDEATVALDEDDHEVHLSAQQQFSNWAGTIGVHSLRMGAAAIPKSPDVTDMYDLEEELFTQQWLLYCRPVCNSVAVQLALTRRIAKLNPVHPFRGQARFTTNTFKPCYICFGNSHPVGLCPFPRLDGWQGPIPGTNKSNTPGAPGNSTRGRGGHRGRRGGRGVLRFLSSNNPSTVGGNGLITPSGSGGSFGLPISQFAAGLGGIYSHGGRNGMGSELGTEPSNPNPVGGNPTVTQETELLTQNLPSTTSHPAMQDRGTSPQSATPRLTNPTPRNGNQPPVFNQRRHTPILEENAHRRGADRIMDDGHKWQDIHHVMTRDQIAVLAVVETHMSQNQVDEISDSFYGKRMKIHSTLDPAHPNAAGVAIILNYNCINTEHAKTHIVIPGRAIYVLGDFNIVEEPADRSNNRNDNQAAVDALIRFKSLFKPKDGWRATHPTKRGYTYSHNGPNNSMTKSRLDRIYVTENLQPSCHHWKISDDFIHLTDHSLVSVVVNTPGTPYRGRGRYTMNLTSLDNPKLISEFIHIGASMAVDHAKSAGESRSDLCNPQTYLQKFNEEIAKAERDFSKKSTGFIKNKIRDLQQKRNEALNSNGNQDQIMKEAYKLESELKDIATRSRTGRKCNRSLKNELENDAITKYSVSHMKEHKSRDPIPHLVGDINPLTGKPTIIRRSDKMAEHARDYHENLQHDPSEANINQKNADIRKVLSEVGQKLNEEDSNSLKTPIDKETIAKALRRSAKGVAAGVSGVPTEVWMKLRARF
ncbi:hypothetical protein BDP27DRAFT_1432637 [Rhodocollybia butyracea]|uniref:Uncharacterized protein n=1 Tax=Rhodocollybia butyracea TaxID=206335 RepID=A0A9P5PA29_9AGAR|nr:hypothetical protein BDP27DRAFT_1432637 [Rhodocollybia butyracea]